MISTDLGTWVAALLTLCAYSILYKENPFYRFAESTVIGFGVGYGFCRTIDSLRRLTYINWLEGNYISIIPVLLGLTLYMRFIPKYRWVQRTALAFATGVGMGLGIQRAVHSQLILQISGALTPIPSDLVGAFTWIVTTVGTITVLLYFVFAHLKSESIQPVRTTGRYLLMIALGAAFAGGTLTWVTDIIVRVQFLLLDWLGL